MNRYSGIFIAFLVLVIFLAIGLNLNPREVPSPLLDKAIPAFDLPQLHQPDKRFSSKDMLGKVWLFNVWASWCVTCRQEHPLLVELSKQQRVPLIGLNHKDQREDALKWLERFGNPYQLSVEDSDGRVGIDFGVYGVPETFLIDKKGMIRYKQIGAITQKVLQNQLFPLIDQLEKEAN